MRLALLPAILALFAAPAHAGSYFVDGSSPGGDGKTPATAFRTLGDAMAGLHAVAATTGLRGTTVVHVAPGTYVLPGSLTIDIPNLILQGSTELSLDERRLPTGVRSGETRVQADGAPQQMFLVTAENVAISHFVFDGRDGSVTFSVFVDGTEAPGGTIRKFVLRENQVMKTFFGTLTRAASGLVEGNLFGVPNDPEGQDFGASFGGGPVDSPASIAFHRNRCTWNNFGATFTGDLCVAAQPSPPPVAAKLYAEIWDNDFSGNGGLGVSLALRENSFAFTGLEMAPASLEANLHDNTLRYNGSYGLVIHSPQGAFGFGNCPEDEPATCHVTATDNVVAGNGIAPALVSFRAYISVFLPPAFDCSECVSCYVRNSSIAVDFPFAYDWDVPAGLGDTLTVNDAAVTGFSVAGVTTPP